MEDKKKELLQKIKEQIEGVTTVEHRKVILDVVSKGFDTLIQSKDQEWKEKIAEIRKKYGDSVFQRAIATFDIDDLTNSTKKEDV